VDRKEIRIGTIDSMSKEEVMRKLDEMKKLYGGPPPKDIIDMDEDEILDSVKKEHEDELGKQVNLREEMRRAEHARRVALQEGKRKPAELSYNEDREQGQSGDAGLSGGDAGGGNISDVGIKGGETGPEGESEPPSDSVSS
jgi:hypothetical protein